MSNIYVPYYRVAQKAIVEHYTAADGATIDRVFTETESGKDIANRKILQQAIQYCLRNNYTLIVAKLDRLSRDVEHIFSIKKKLGDLFKSCDLPNTDSLTLSIFAGLAQRERELIKLGNPQHLTSISRTNSIISIKRKAAENVNNTRAMSLIVRCKKDGMSLAAIATELNNNGFLTAKNKSFQKTTVQRLYNRYLACQ